MVTANDATEAVGLKGSNLAWGVHGISDWVEAMAFIDVMKTSRPLAMHGEGQPAVNYPELKELGLLDENGWPTAIDPAYERFATVWAWDNDSTATEDRKGIFVVEYEGEGTIEFKNVEVLSSEPGKIVLNNPNGGPMLMYITETDPNKNGENIRDISIVHEDHLALHEAGAIFNPKWLSIIEDGQLLRYLNWMNGNSPSIENWEDRTKIESPTWFSEDGVPVEIIVKLSNQVGADPWFTVPHTASDDHVRKFAEYVRDNLDPELIAHVEFSNEHWNFGFDQFHDMAAASRDEWGQNAPYQYFAKRSTEVAVIWEEVFGEESDARLVNVIGTHTANAWNVTQMLDPDLWESIDPDGYVDPDSVFEAVGVTTYFGVATVANQEMRDELLAKIADPNVDASVWLKEKLLDPNYKHSIPQVVEEWKAIKEFVEPRGIKMLAYEGGQHVHHLAFLQGISNELAGELAEYLGEFTRSEHMAELYAVLWDEWKKYGDGPFMQFGDVGAPGKWGSFSAYSHLDDSNPRTRLLVERMLTEQAAYASGLGTQYQQGKVLYGTAGDDTIIGTVQEDFLIGGAGDDVFVGGAKDDGINGGAGYDTLLLTGRKSDYTVEKAGDGFEVVGLDGTDFVVNVETLLFENGEEMELDGTDTSTPLPDDPVVTPNDTTTDPTPTDPNTSVPEDDIPTVSGNDGDDAISQSGVGGVRLVGGDGSDQLSVLDGYGEIIGDKGNDIIVGGVGSDSLFGGHGNDVIIGDRASFLFGNDEISGGKGDDLLMGGKGADVFIFGRNDGTDQIGKIEINSDGSPTLTNGSDFQSGLDKIDLTEFGFLDGQEALEQFTDTGGDAVFSDQGTTIILKDINTIVLSEDDFIV